MHYKPYFNEAPDSQENALAHFGVLGMKWGVRKDSNSGGSKRQAEIQKKLKEFKKISILLRALKMESSIRTVNLF